MDFRLIKVDWLIIWAVRLVGLSPPKEWSMDFVNEFTHLNFEEASE